MRMDADDLVRMNSVLRHRLRNFASGVRNAVSLLSVEIEGKLPPESMEYFPLIKGECDRLADMTQRMSLLFDPEFPADSQAVGSNRDESVIDFLTRLTDEIHTGFPAATISHAVEPSAQNTAVPATHAARIAIIEAVRNSIESDANGEIIISCSHNKGLLRFEVIDYGAGANEEDIPRVFDPFFSKRSRHLGIGLTIARNVLIGSGGNVNFESVPGAATTLCIELPLEQAPNDSGEECQP